MGGPLPIVMDDHHRFGYLLPSRTPSDIEFNNLIRSYNEAQVLLFETVALLNWASGEVESVQKCANEMSLRLNTSVGNDPGIGHYDQAGTFSSAWEGIQYVNNCVRTIDDIYGRAKMENLEATKLFRTKLDLVTEKFRERDNQINSRLMEPSGRYAHELDQHVKSLVESTLDAWLNSVDLGGDGGAMTPPSNTQLGGGQGGDGGSPNDGHNALAAVGSGATAVEHELGLRAEVERLREEVKELRLEVDYLKSVTSTGSIKFELTELEFDSEKALLDYLRKIDRLVSLPSDLHVLCMDFWAALDYACSTVDGEDRQSSDAQLAKQMEAATKAKFNSAESLSRQCGFRRHLPLAVEPHNTPVSPDPVTTPLPGVKKYTDLDNRGEGQPGRKQMIVDEFTSHLITTKTAIRDNLKSSEHRELREFLEAFISAVKDHNQLFFEWVKNAYDYERRNCAEAESWALVGGYIRAIFTDMRDARLVGRSTSGLTGLAKDARLMWAMGMGAMKFQEFCDVQFQAHPSCVAVHTQYITRARTPLSAHRALEQKFKTINGEFAKLSAAVEKLKKTKSSGGGGGTGGQTGNN